MFIFIIIAIYNNNNFIDIISLVDFSKSNVIYKNNFSNI